MTLSSSVQGKAPAPRPAEEIRRVSPLEAPHTGLSPQEAARRVVEFYARAQARLHLADGAEPEV